MRRRSVSYPVLDLESAIERTGRLYLKHGVEWIPRADVLCALGRSPRSGPGGRELSALRQFGLVSYRDHGGELKVQVTGDGAVLVVAQRAGR